MPCEQVCFSNEFSTVAHKTVYLDLIVGNRDDPLAAKAEQHRQTFTQLETSVASVHDSLRKVIDFQVGLFDCFVRLRPWAQACSVSHVVDCVFLLSFCVVTPTASADTPPRA